MKRLHNITKEAAFDWWQYKRNEYPTEKLANLIYRVTVHREEYSYGEYNFDMSYICRLFNITEFGASNRENIIKGRYKKYQNNEKIRDIIFKIIRENPNGFMGEYPRFDDLLEQALLNMSTFQDDEVLFEETSHYNTRIQQNTWSSEERSLRGANTFSGGKILVAIIAVFLVIKGVGFIGSGISSVFVNTFSEDNFETYKQDEVMYVGGLKGGKPNGLCAAIPNQSDGTSYALGEFDGTVINGLGISCYSSLPLQGDESMNASLYISMGEMKKNTLNGKGLIWSSSDEIIIGEYKNGELKKYGCKIILDENGDILKVIGIKKDKEKKELKGGTYKGMKYNPESAKIEIADFTFTISGGKVSIETDSVNISVKGTDWSFESFNKDKSVCMNYILGKNVRCTVTSETSNGTLVNKYELPIEYVQRSY